MPPEHKTLVYRNQGWISAVVLVDGRFVGVWEYDKKSTNTLITVKLFAKPTKTIKQGIEAEAARLSKFMASEIELAYAQF